MNPFSLFALGMASTPAESAPFDIAIIGGGVVGCAIAREASAVCGLSVVVLEREDDLLSQASGSNSGILCTGVDTTAPIERALIRDSNSLFRQVYRELNVPYLECGSLVCNFKSDNNNDNHSKLRDVLEESHMAGDTHAKLLDAKEVAEMEPNLARTTRAVHIPGETVVDPWLSAIALAVHARQNGAVFYTKFAVDRVESSDDEQGCWTIYRLENGVGEDENERPQAVRARVIVNAAGLWADEVQGKVLLQPPAFKAKPRRGQYVVLGNTPGTTCPIQPIPTQFSKGVFVFSTLYDQVVVGPTAVDQQSKTDRSVDDQVRQQLQDYCDEVLPSSKSNSVIIGDYVGLRPATEHRDYQITCNPSRRWLTVAGIRSTGLTASLGLGRHCLHLLTSTGLLTPNAKYEAITRPLQDVSVLAGEYRQGGCDCVNIDGSSYRVTHPLTRWGWAAGTGLAAEGRR